MMGARSRRDSVYLRCSRGSKDEVRDQRGDGEEKVPKRLELEDAASLV
jgi:hypothetical protein